MKNNKKGFTLVELLAVIVILAVVALIGMTAIGPVMANSRKAALRNDGLDLIASARTAYQAEGLKSDPKFRATDSVCMSYGWLVANGYADGKAGYDGSVLVKYNDDTKNNSFQYWLGNNEYTILEANESSGYDKAEVADDYFQQDESKNYLTYGSTKYRKFKDSLSTCNDMKNITRCTATIEYKTDDAGKTVLTADVKSAACTEVK